MAPRRINVLEIANPVTAAAGRLLADAGAAVVKLESPGTRIPDGGAAHARRLYQDTDKRSVGLDLGSSAGRELLLRLIPHFDIVVEAGRPGELAQAGLGYDVLSAANPRVTLVSITPFGQDGPYAGYDGDDLVAFAMGGLMFISGDPDLPPVVAPCEQAYMVAGVHAAMGALACYRAALQTGRGEWVDVSMMECLAAQENTVTNFRSEEEFSRRTGSQHRTANPGRIFACRDGYVHIFINQDRKVWERFVAWMGSPPELAAPELAEINERWRQADVVDGATVRFMAAHTREELATTAQEAHLPVAPVYDIGETMADPQVRYLDILERVDGDGDRSYATLRPPLQRGRPPIRRSPAPRVGEATDDLLAELLGLAPAERDALRSAGVV
jgi:crotonobetainyl-CoA:carnitine CoA-transferase CaiB-like acyl-CoA transferase